MAMPRFPYLAALVGIVLPMLALPAAAAGPTTYNCSGDGVSWVSTRPCPGAHNTELRGMGNNQPPPSSGSTYGPAMAKAPEYLQYLSVECAQLNDAIRTGPARGLKSGPMDELQSDYRKRCAEEDQLARKRQREADDQQRDRREDQQAAVKAEKTRAATSSEQCYEMLRILHGKRQRVATMNDGERADLQRFEDNYKSRCPRG